MNGLVGRISEQRQTHTKWQEEWFWLNTDRWNKALNIYTPPIWHQGMRWNIYICIRIYIYICAYSKFSTERGLVSGYFRLPVKPSIPCPMQIPQTTGQIGLVKWVVLHTTTYLYNNVIVDVTAKDTWELGQPTTNVRPEHIYRRLW